jgi:site-specific DNA-methyltransferase (adenine-specific)
MRLIETPHARLWNGDYIAEMRTHISDGAVDLVLADPPYGIRDDGLDVHYNRNERFAVEGYVEVNPADYPAFTRAWIAEAARCLHPGGAMMVVSSWSHNGIVLQAFSEAGLTEGNHLLWRYSFGVYTTRKIVTPHYHIPYWVKPHLSKATFDPQARFLDPADFYHDRQDDLDVPRKNKLGQAKNKNQLPEALLERLLVYTTRPGDVVLDPFMGGCTTARVAVRMGCTALGFEMNPKAFDRFASGIADVSLEPCPAPIAPNPKDLALRVRMRKTRNLRRAQAKAQGTS